MDDLDVLRETDGVGRLEIEARVRDLCDEVARLRADKEENERVIRELRAQLGIFAQ